MLFFDDYLDKIASFKKITAINFDEKLKELVEDKLFSEEKFHLFVIQLFINDEEIYKHRIEKFLNPKSVEFDFNGDFDALNLILIFWSYDLFFFFESLNEAERKQLAIKCLDIFNIGNAIDELPFNYEKVQKFIYQFGVFHHSDMLDVIPDNIKKIELMNEVINLLNRGEALVKSLAIPHSEPLENCKSFYKEKKEYYKEAHFIEKESKKFYNVDSHNHNTYKDYTNIFQKSMPIELAVSHFKKLTLNNSKNGRPFLTEEQLDVFIRKAFCGVQDLPKQTFNQVPRGEKFIIQYVFREFYDANWFYFGTGQVQDKFIKLLTENFTDWDFENVRNNFSTKPKKTI